MRADMTTRKALAATRTATALITNPTHFSVALRYELGMPAPMVVAKGKEFLALRMREIAKENDVPIIENRPLARALYKQVAVGEEIPLSLYTAVSEIIKYVFRIKGIRIPKRPTEAKV